MLYVVLHSWWWTERPSETCRVLFQNKINLRYCASGWFYYRNILRCTVLQTSNLSKNLLHKVFFFCFVLFLAQQPPSGPRPSHSRGFYITHNDAPQSVGLLSTSDQPVAHTSTWQHTTLTTDIHAPGGIRTHNPSRRAAADPRLRPRGYWNRLT